MSTPSGNIVVEIAAAVEYRFVPAKRLTFGAYACSWFCTFCDTAAVPPTM